MAFALPGPSGLNRKKNSERYELETEQSENASEEVETPLAELIDQSEEDTEEASENEQKRPEPVYRSAKDQIYHEKYEALKRQLKELEEGTSLDFIKRVKKLEMLYEDRLQMNRLWREHVIEVAENEYADEKKAAVKEFEERRLELKDNILHEIEERRKNIEVERQSLELTGDSTDHKPAITRKLRRRPNDPAPLPEKRRGKLGSSHPSQLNFLLDEKEIEADLKVIQRAMKQTSIRRPTNDPAAFGSMVSDPPVPETRIEDGKLLFEKKWFHRGQTIYVEGKDMPKFPGIISSIGSEAISVKKTVDSSKVKIHVNQLIRGKIIIKRRAS